MTKGVISDSTSDLVSPSFSDVHISDIITPGLEDEVGHSLMNKEGKARWSDESPGN